MARSARSPRQGQRRPALALALALALTLTLTLTNPNQVSGGPADRDWRALHRLLCGTLDDGIEARGWADSSELENAAEVHGGGYRMPHACLMHAPCMPHTCIPHTCIPHTCVPHLRTPPAYRTCLSYLISPKPLVRYACAGAVCLVAG